MGDLGDDLLHEHGHGQAVVAQFEDRRFLFHDFDFVVEIGGVVGADLGAVAVLERGDDSAPVGVVLGVGGGDDEHIEGQAHLVAANLDVAFLEQVQQPHLDALGQVGQFVDGEDARLTRGTRP